MQRALATTTVLTIMVLTIACLLKAPTQSPCQATWPSTTKHQNKRTPMATHASTVRPKPRPRTPPWTPLPNLDGKLALPRLRGQTCAKTRRQLCCVEDALQPGKRTLLEGRADRAATSWEHCNPMPAHGAYCPRTYGSAWAGAVARSLQTEKGSSTGGNRDRGRQRATPLSVQQS